MIPSPVRIVYLPANDAYMVMWHDQRLAGPMTLNDANLFCNSVYSTEGSLT
jgi:hypothetical protein